MTLPYQFRNLLFILICKLQHMQTSFINEPFESRNYSVVGILTETCFQSESAVAASTKFPVSRRQRVYVDLLASAGMSVSELSEVFRVFIQKYNPFSVAVVVYFANFDSRNIF